MRGGRGPLLPPFFSLPPRRGFAGAGAPAPNDAGAPPCTRGSFLRDGSPSPQRCEGFPLCTPQSGRSALHPGLLSRVEKVGKDTPGTSWFLDLRHKGEDPLGFPRPPALAVLVVSKKARGILGGIPPAEPRIENRECSLDETKGKKQDRFVH